MDISLRLTQSLTSLRRLFVKTTVPANMRAFRSDLQTRISMYNLQKQKEDPAKQTAQLELLDEDKLTPAFSLFYTDGIIYANNGNASSTTSGDSTKLKYVNAIEEYLFFKEKAWIQYQIMEANRVGVDKNMASIITQTAAHVGLQMPKQFKEEEGEDGKSSETDKNGDKK